MSPRKVSWLFMQGFTIKYYPCEAEGGDFVVNRQALTLHTRMTWQVPLRHNSYQAARKRCANTGKRRSLAKGPIVYIKGLQRKEKYKRVFRGSIRILIVRIKGDCAGVSAVRKRNGLKLAVPVQPAKCIKGLLPVPVRNGLPLSGVWRSWFYHSVAVGLSRYGVLRIRIWNTRRAWFRSSSVPYLHEVRFRQLKKESCSWFGSRFLPLHRNSGKMRVRLLRS